MRRRRRSSAFAIGPSEGQARGAKGRARHFAGVLALSATWLGASNAFAQAAPPPAAPPPEAAPPPAVPPPAAPPPEAAPPPTAPPPEAAPAEPAPAAPAPPAPTPAPTNAAPPKDELATPGYLPGYRRHASLGLSPYTPRVGSLPGGITPGYGAPLPSSEWTFRWSGFMTASLQTSIDQRRYPSEGQERTVFHVPPATIDEYAAFTSTSSVPGNWVSMNFTYGKESVNATVSIATWNPTRPTTYYQFGSQYFINDAYLLYRLPPIGALKLHWRLGYFASTYGALGRYGNGMYANPIAGSPRGVGETTVAEYDFNDKLTLVLEHGFMGTRDGNVPEAVISSSETRNANPIVPGAWIHHAHAGLIVKSEPQLEFQAHYLTNWSAEDRNELPEDVMFSDAVDESNIPDGRISVYAFDARLNSNTWGYLAAGVALIDARDAFTLRGLTTYAGEGEHLTERWLTVATGGTGKLLVAGINYGVSLGKIVSHPTPFGGDGPDVVLNTGFHITRTSTGHRDFDGRIRHRYGIDGLYTFLQYMGAGLRIDRVVPNSRNADETFHVVAPRLQFKSGWNSREVIQLMYAKWFYGSATRNEGTGERSPERLDDQLFALNFNMWW